MNIREAGLARMDPGVLISYITDVMTEVLGEQIRENATVHLIGVPAGRSGVGGEVA